MNDEKMTDANIIGYRLEWRSKSGKNMSTFYKPDQLDDAIKAERKLASAGEDHVYLTCILREPSAEAAE